MSVLASTDSEVQEFLRGLGVDPVLCSSCILKMQAGEVVQVELEQCVLEGALAPQVEIKKYRLVAFDDAELRAKFEKILAPAVDCRAPYARVMLDEMVKAVVG